MTVLENLLGHEVDDTTRAQVSYRLRSGVGALGNELATKLEETYEPPAPPAPPAPPPEEP